MGLSAGLHDVALFSYPEITELFEPLGVEAAPSFNNCYTEFRTLSALAWSPDGRFFTTPGEGSRLTLRKTCDQAPVAELEPEIFPFCSLGETQPGLAAFSPAGDHLAVWWGGVIGMYRLFE
jgi:hypothetical protein